MKMRMRRRRSFSRGRRVFRGARRGRGPRRIGYRM